MTSSGCLMFSQRTGATVAILAPVVNSFTRVDVLLVRSSCCSLKAITSTESEDPSSAAHLRYTGSQRLFAETGRISPITRDGVNDVQINSVLCFSDRGVPTLVRILTLPYTLSAQPDQSDDVLIIATTS